MRIFPEMYSVENAPSIEPGIINIRSFDAISHLMAISLWYLTLAAEDENKVMGRGLANARYGGIEKNILSMGVLIELPPKPNMPESSPMTKPVTVINKISSL